ncbi:uncharacterized protein LOC143058916 [Mytilus galloprovincialis]|uniref:uncharacterized protein LOC143058916 n=1 Tax=Mytilus galloprovincialis TaxID=29158 RepID=UPI003F7C8526
MADISFDEFFKLFNLDDMKVIFVSNDFISVRCLIEVTNEDLKDMGFLSLGKRKEFQAAVREIKEKRSQVEMDETTAVEKVVSNDLESPSSLIKFDASIEINNRTSTPLAKRKLDMNETDTPVQIKLLKTDNLNNRSPSSWILSPLNQEKILAAKKIKLFSKDEMSKAYGLRKKKMAFMNGKLKEFMNDPDIRSCGKHVIMGMAKTAWDRFNADDAKIAVAEVEVLISKLQQKGKKYTDKQTKTITRLTERLNRGKHEVAASLKRISALRETESDNSNIVNEEKELVAFHCELQKQQMP